MAQTYPLGLPGTMLFYTESSVIDFLFGVVLLCSALSKTVLSKEAVPFRVKPNIFGKGRN